VNQVVVVRYKDGRVTRGTTSDFKPNRTSFTLRVDGPSGISRKVRVVLERVKAVFFVKSLDGNREYSERKLQAPRNPMGKRLMVTFLDGECLRGTTLGVNLNMPGFLLFPSDPESNNKRIFVIKSALKEIREES
jgi:hypothetical protein